MKNVLIATGAVVLLGGVIGGMWVLGERREYRDEADGARIATSTTNITTPYTVADVAAHSSEESCWTVVNGGVYDVTAFIGRHPGGPSRILAMCGRDASSDFDEQHDADKRALSMLEGLQIGILAQ